MSFTITVPEAVPSVFHNSAPFVPSFAWKYKELPTTVKSLGLLEPPPLLMSFSITVPEAVPSLFHNSAPFVPSFAWKKRVLPRTSLASAVYAPKGVLEPLPLLMSLTIQAVPLPL